MTPAASISPPLHVSFYTDGTEVWAVAAKRQDGVLVEHEPVIQASIDVLESPEKMASLVESLLEGANPKSATDVLKQATGERTHAAVAKRLPYQLSLVFDPTVDVAVILATGDGNGWVATRKTKRELPLDSDASLLFNEAVRVAEHWILK